MPLAARFAFKAGLTVAKFGCAILPTRSSTDLTDISQGNNPKENYSRNNELNLGMASLEKSCAASMKGIGKRTLKRDISDGSSRRIIINVSGERFETTEKTLSNFPNTLLGCESRRDHYFDPVNGEYVFRRNKDSFHLILFYYQSNGILAQPAEEFIPQVAFEDEVKFFELGKAAEIQLPKKFGADFTFGRVHKSGRRTLDALRLLLNNPYKTTKGKLIGAWISCLIFLCVTVKSVKTLPEVRALSAEAYCCQNETAPPNLATRARNLELIWFVIELICACWFGLEYLLRIYAAPRRGRYIFGGLGIIDFLSCVPHFVLIGIDFTNALTPEIFPLRNLLKFLPFVCILKVTRYSTGVQLFWKTLHTCNKELILLLFCVIISVVLFGSVIYFFENGENGFISIPASFWYAIVTMTTVGYGDLTAVTFGGKLFSACCALLGVSSLLALPTTVVTNKFSTYYNAKRDAKRRKYSVRRKLASADVRHGSVKRRV